MPTTSNRRPTADSVLRALADDRRRAVLSFLRGRDEPVDVERVAAHLAAGTDEDRAALHRELHHAHLPKLDASGLVAYDPVAGSVALREPGTDAGSLNTLLTEADRIAPGG